MQLKVKHSVSLDEFFRATISLLIHGVVETKKPFRLRDGHKIGQIGMGPLKEKIIRFFFHKGRLYH